MHDLAIQKYELRTSDIRNLNRVAKLETILPRNKTKGVSDYWSLAIWFKKYPYSKAFEIPEKMHKLLNWSNKNRDVLHPAQYAVDLHQKFVIINPFRDSNGRAARLLVAFALIPNGYSVININPFQKYRQ